MNSAEVSANPDAAIPLTSTIVPEASNSGSQELQDQPARSLNLGPVATPATVAGTAPALAPPGLDPPGPTPALTPPGPTKAAMTQLPLTKFTAEGKSVGPYEAFPLCRLERLCSPRTSRDGRPVTTLDLSASKEIARNLAYSQRKVVAIIHIGAIACLISTVADCRSTY